MKHFILFFLIALVTTVNTASSQSFQGLPEKVSAKVKYWAVVFDFEDDSCYPAPAISKEGKKNGGLKASGTRTGDCRGKEQFLNANTFCRTKSIVKDGVTYEVMMYALYFQKDQYAIWTPIELKGSHRHDWEYASVWLTNGNPTHATYSAHGKDGETKPINSLFFDAGMENHVKIVYHQDGFSTHCMRFAEKDEKPKNELGKWVTPKLVEWDLMTSQQRNLLAQDWGSANPPFIDKNFYKEIGKYLPVGYPKKAEWE
jgi:hypothetical protein